MKVLNLIKKNQSILFPVFDILMNILNYFFHIFVSWYLIPEQYGVLNALLSFTAILLVSGVSLQLFTANNISRLDGEFNQIVRNSINSGLFIVLFFTILLPFFINFLSNFIRSSKFDIILIHLIFSANVFLSIMRGIFQGKQKFLFLNGNFYIEGFVKLFFIVLLLPKFKTPTAALLTVFLGMFFSLLHGYYANRKEMQIKDLKIKLNKTLILSLGTIFVSNFFIFYFVSIDMIFVNHFIPNLSGEYSVVLRYSQIINFIFISIMTVLLPNLGVVAKDIRKLKKAIIKFGGLLVVLEFILLILYKFFVPLTIPYLFGEKYIKAGEFLVFGCVVYILLSMILFMININIVVEGRKYLSAMAFSGVTMTVLFLIFNKTIYQFLYAEIINYFILFVLMIIITTKEVNKNDKRSN